MASFGGSLVYATLIILVAALPALALSGVPELWRSRWSCPTPWRVVASLIVAFTVTPALALLLLGNESTRRLDRGDSRPLVGRGLRPVDRQARPAAAPGRTPRSAFFSSAGWPYCRSSRHVRRCRDCRTGTCSCAGRPYPGTSITEMSRITAAATQELRAVPGVRDVGSHVGRAIMSDQTANVNTAEIWVDVAQSADYGSTVSAVDRTVRGYPGLRGDVQTYAQARVERGRERHPCGRRRPRVRQHP